MGKKQAALALAILLILMVAGWWEVSALQSKSAPAPVPASVETGPHYVQAALPLVVHHSFAKHTHTYSGSAEVRAACASLASGVQSEGEHPIRVTLLLTLTKPAKPCSSSVATSSADFSVSFETAGAEAPVFTGVLVNGKEASSTLIEAN